jgi:hypothetical protein
VGPYDERGAQTTGDTVAELDDRGRRRTS